MRMLAYELSSSPAFGEIGVDVLENAASFANQYAACVVKGDDVVHGTQIEDDFIKEGNTPAHQPRVAPLGNHSQPAVVAVLQNLGNLQTKTHIQQALLILVVTTSSG